VIREAKFTQQQTLEPDVPELYRTPNMTAMALDLKEQTHDTRSHPKALTPGLTFNASTPHLLFKT
jgi:hypothetical protein